MHRIDTATAQKDKFGAGKNGFTRGNPQTGTPATDLDDDYFDMIQEELCRVVEESGEELDKGKHDQLLTALRALLLSRSNPFGDIASDGPEAIATALANLGLGDAVKMDASTLDITSNSLVAKIPVLFLGVQRALIIQASSLSSSSTSGAIVFPAAFPNACIVALTHDYSSAGTDLSNVKFNVPSQTSVNWYAQNMGTGSTSTPPSSWGWLAIGW
ncbi:gp53-like domain-containing protein [Citrobacter amalonaticus]|uniref:gp53-like domain-containing protein n=1 Tax=Citrobacter amalonaticus TaxID=35703 RepID=UPI003884790C